MYQIVNAKNNDVLFEHEQLEGLIDLYMWATTPLSG